MTFHSMSVWKCFGVCGIRARMKFHLSAAHLPLLTCLYLARQMSGRWRRWCRDQQWLALLPSSPKGPGCHTLSSIDLWKKPNPHNFSECICLVYAHNVTDIIARYRSVSSSGKVVTLKQCRMMRPNNNGDGSRGVAVIRDPWVLNPWCWGVMDKPWGALCLLTVPPLHPPQPWPRLCYVPSQA